MAEPTLAETIPSLELPGATAPRPRPQMLGKYRIESRLGKGGMGVVYQAEDTLLQRRVAIKVLPRKLSSDPVALERFLFEARSAARLSHPNIVLVYEISEVQGGWFLVLELVSGGSVQGVLNQRGPLPWPEAVAIVADACRGLIAAHEQGLIHRDIKPANILLTSDGTGKVAAKLADFGLAKALDAEQAPLTSPDTILGTPAFMSPEQCRANPLDARSDLYSLGCTLYTMLTGKAAFEFKAPIEMLYAHCNAPRPDPRRYQPGVPAELVTLLHAALAIAPEDRFASAREMLQALERFTARAEQTAAIPVVEPVPATPPPLPVAKKKKTLKQRRPTVIITPEKKPPATESPTRRWLLRGLLGSAGLGAFLWIASRKEETDAPAEGPFWSRLGAQGASFPVGGPVSAVAISPDLHWAAAASETAGVSVWDLTTGTPVPSLQGLRAGESTRTLAFHPDSKTLLAGIRGRLLSITPAAASVTELPLPLPQFATLSCLTFSPRGDTVLFGRQALEAPLGAMAGSQLYLMRPGRPADKATTGPLPSGAFLAIAYVPDRPEIITVAQDGTLRAFNAQTLALLKSNGKDRIAPGERGQAFGLAITPTTAADNYPAGPHIAVADAQGLYFRQLADWSAVRVFWPLNNGTPRSIAYSPTSRYWAAGVSDGRILIRDNDRRTGTVSELTGHSAAVRAVTFASRGNLLLSGSDDRTIRLTVIAEPA